MTLWQLGLLIFLLAGALNAVFINLDIGGIPRELARLSILAGLAIFIVGLIKRKKRGSDGRSQSFQKLK